MSELYTVETITSKTNSNILGYVSYVEERFRTKIYNYMMSQEINFTNTMNFLLAVEELSKKNTNYHGDWLLPLIRLVYVELIVGDIFFDRKILFNTLDNIVKNTSSRPHGIDKSSYSNVLTYDDYIEYTKDVKEKESQLDRIENKLNKLLNDKFV
jgi:hypothetical protein